MVWVIIEARYILKNLKFDQVMHFLDMYNLVITGHRPQTGVLLTLF